MVLRFVSPHHSQFEVIQAAAQLQLAQGEDDDDDALIAVRLLLPKATLLCPCFLYETEK